MTILLLIVGLLLFIGLVLFHEFGHYIMARRNGVEVEEFGLGFPPRAKVLTKRKGTIYTLNWLPLGGFVKLKGEHDSDTEPGTFGSATLWAKTKILLAGVGMNLAAALVLFTLLGFVGMPVLINEATLKEKQFTVASDERIVQQKVLVSSVDPQSPAGKAGLQPLDRIVSITEQNGTVTQLKQLSELQAVTKRAAGQQVGVTYERDGKTTTTGVTLRSAAEVEASLNTKQPKGYFGVSLSNYQVNRYTWSAPVVAAGLTAQVTKLTLKGLGTAVAGLGKTIAGLVTGNSTARQAGQAQATEQVSGPVGIFYILKAGAQEGYATVLYIVALISLTLAIMNVLPIPALDGGRLFVTLLFRVLRRPLTERTEEMIHGTGFAVLMVLFALITFVDIGRFTG